MNIMDNALDKYLDREQPMIDNRVEVMLYNEKYEFL
jgi:hypothetical protein